MTNVFFIGRSRLRQDLEALLEEKKTIITRFPSLNTVRSRTEKLPDIIIIDIQQNKEPKFKEFLTAFSQVPLIVLSNSNTFTGFSAWLKHAFVFPLVNPSPKELAFALQRVVREKDLALRNLTFKKTIEDMRRELEFFEEVSKALTSALELNEVLRTITMKTKALIHAEICSILLRDEESGDLILEKTPGKKEGSKRARKDRLKIGEGIAGWVAQEQVPVIVPDVSKDPRFRSHMGATTGGKIKSMMCVPIRTKDNVLGVIEVANKTTKEPFTKEDLDLILKIADHASIAIERSALYQKMAEMSITDDLTKLFNTRYLTRTLEIEITRARRHLTSLSLIFMDVDHFKNINDNYGHLVGSKLLVEIGQLLLKALRTVDIVARYGGDEFVIVLPQTTPKNATNIAERIRRNIEQNVFLKKDGYAFKVTASFGVASFPESAQSQEELVRLADEAMYRVKYQTRNGVYAIV